VNNQDNNNTISSFSTTKQLPVEKIFHCLASCADCTGSYVSEILGMRFICCCQCHMKSKDLVGLSHTIKASRNNHQAVTRHLNETDREDEEQEESKDGVRGSESSNKVVPTSTTKYSTAQNTVLIPKEVSPKEVSVR
jgi:hypothetical protein